MSKRILVIDDEASVRKSFIIALEDTGYTVHTAESGEAGIERVDRQKYDLIFLDLNMPGLNGVETLRELRQRDNDVPVYFQTAFQAAFTGQLRQLAQDGMDFQVLRKPLNPRQIADIAKGVLEGAEITE